MAKITDIQAALDKPQNGQLVPGERLNQLLDRVDIRKKFEDMLGAKAPGFLSSILSLTNANQALKACEPMSIIAAAAIAATLDLPINQSLGYAYIIPYKGVAQFQIGYKGLIQLAMRTGLYQTMNAVELYEGELISYNRITGETVIDESQKKSDKIVAYVAYIKLKTGFEKYLMMTVDQIEKHAKRYSQSFNRPNGPWTTNRESMSMKTPLKMLLSKYGVLSIEIQKAIEFDQAVAKDLPSKDGAIDVTYPDNPDTPVDAGTAIEPE